MKFMLMIEGRQADYDAMSGKPGPQAPAWSQEDLQKMVRFMQELNEELAAKGELIDGQGLSAPSEGGLVTASRDGAPVVSTDGYGSDRPVLAGYWLLECRDFDRAAEIAARVHQCPAPEGSANPPVVVRRVQEQPPVQ